MRICIQSVHIVERIISIIFISKLLIFLTISILYSMMITLNKIKDIPGASEIVSPCFLLKT